MSGVVHFEIPADDEERARGFYRDAFDWRLDVLPDLGYTNVVTTPVDETTQAPLEPGAINGGMFERTSDLPNPIITVGSCRSGRWASAAAERRRRAREVSRAACLRDEPDEISTRRDRGVAPYGPYRARNHRGAGTTRTSAQA